MVQRLKTKKEALLELAKVFYMIFGFPLLLLIGIFMLFIINSGKSMGRVPGDTLGAVIIWAAIIVSVGIFVYGVLSRNRLLKKITAGLKDSVYFKPQEGYEMYHQGDGKYLGIDTLNS